MVVGDNGIIEKAKNAKSNTENAQQEENDILKDYESKIDEYSLGSIRDGIPVTLDENEHEIGTLNGKKLYQKTFIDRELVVTTKDRKWYSLIGNDELKDLNMDVAFIDYGNSFRKLAVTKGTDSDTIYSLNNTFSATSYDLLSIYFDKNGNRRILALCCGGPITNDSTNGTRYYYTVTLKYTKKDTNQ